MIVSDRHRFIFVHIPKSGGTSCAKALKRALPLWEQGHWISHHRSKHEQLHEILRRMQSESPPLRFFWQKNNGDPTSYFCFGFVRNPWDRVVSVYHYAKRASKVPEIQTLESFDEFVDGIEQQAPWIERMYSFKTQLSYLTDENGTMRADFVGRFESFEQDFEYACQQLGIRVRLPHLNKSSHDHYSRYYTPRMIQIVADRFADDIEAFGYRFEDANTARAA